MNKNELNIEKKYLDKVNNELDLKIKNYQNQYNNHIEEQKKLSEQFSESFYEMDDEESLTEGARIAEYQTIAEFLKNNIERFKKQKKTAYFGSVVFGEHNQTNKYYIGVHNVSSNEQEIPLVCDWRASVSSLFYDYELGNAKYLTENGEVCGEISAKRQYVIKNSKLLSAFDSSITIGDEILKEVLSESSNSKMKTIVSTIQKEQNEVIRAKVNRSMLVQGCAGSGKTSIALHRIAYLLYQNKNNIKSSDVLILSPNKLFSSYIADVLPELGEENIPQMSFYRFAQKQLENLGLELEKREDALEEIITSKQNLNFSTYKHSYEFFENLQKFCERYFVDIFTAQNLVFGNVTITAKEIQDLYTKTYINKTPAIRVEWIVDYIIDKLNLTKNLDEISKKIKTLLYPFFKEGNLIKVYATFLTNIGMQFSLNKKEQIRYEDIGGILYIANYFLGLEKFKEVKYLIIDEMQDYSFATYSVLNSVFSCNKTVLGDINQCVEKVMTQEELKILAEMLNADLVEIKKSYRNTYQIAKFACKIKGLEYECFERNGDEPKVVDADLPNLLKNVLKTTKYNNYAILTKTSKEAQNVYKELKTLSNVSLNIDYESEVAQVCVMPSYMSKGLEFDVVIVPNYNKINYKTVLDWNLLYIASTRAMHKLFFVK